MKRLGNKGISTIYGSILLIILVLTLAAILFLTLYKYNHSVHAAIKFEEERTQERIVLYKLETQNLSETEYVSAIFVNNTGSITSRIRAVYIDNEFLCDPSNNTINPDDTYINPQRWLRILLPPEVIGVVYEPEAKMTVATERGIKSSEYEWKLKEGGGPYVPHEVKEFYFGPLRLDFNKFYYTECDPSSGSYDPSTWKPGWAIEIGTGSIVWNITVKNVDDRNITINQFSCFTLFPNKSPSNRRAWYIEPLNGAFTQFIAVNETVNIIYIWETPKMKQMNPQEIYTTVCRNKVFLTFFGIFHEKDGTTKPYGQTIPFEAVLCVQTGGTIDISAWPTIILANSTMSSTITAKVYNVYGNPVANANITFSTDLGSLSSLWAITDANGTATVTLYPTTSPGVANVTATWERESQSTTVIFNGRPVASFTWSPETVFTGDLIIFNASDSYDPDGNITSYFWDFGDGTNGTGIIANHTYIDAGIYTVTLTITDNRNATASTSATTVIMNRSPIIDEYYPPSDPIILEGESQEFNVTYQDPEGDPLTVQWYLNGTLEVDSDSYIFNANYDSAGVYNVTVVVLDGLNQTSHEWTLTVEDVNRAPTIDSYTPENLGPQVDEGDSLDFTHTSSDLDGDTLNYSWLLDGVVKSVTQNWTYSPGSGDGGAHNVTLVVSDGSLFDSQQWNVTVVPQFELIIGVVGNGTTSPVPGLYLYSEGSNVNVTAVPESGWILSHWILNGTDVGSANPYSFVINSNCNLTAFFVVEPLGE